MDRSLLVHQSGIYVMEADFSEKGLVEPWNIQQQSKDFSLLFDQSGVDEILPNNCKYVTRSSSEYTTLVIEEPPRIRNVKIKASVLAGEIDLLIKSGKMKEYKIDEWLSKNEKRAPDTEIYYELSLSFPYIIFIISMSRYQGLYSRSIAKVFYRTSPMTDLNDKLIVANVTNNDNVSGLCSPSESYSSLKLASESVISGFWNAMFTDHGSTQYFEYLKKDINVSSWLYWQYLSKTNPTFVFSEEWTYSGTSIITEIDRLQHNGYNIHNIISSLDFDNKVRSQKNNRNNYLSYERLFTYDGRTILFCHGDEIVYNEKPYFVEFFTKDSVNREEKIFLESIEENPEKLILVLTDEVKQELAKSTLKKEILKLEIDDKVFNVGDVITFTQHFRSKTSIIKKIRKNRLGLWEIKFVGEYFSLVTKEMLNDMKVIFDRENINKKFSVLYNYGLRYPMVKTFFDGDLKNITDRNNEITFDFVDEEKKMSVYSASCSLHEYDKFHETLQKFDALEHSGLLFINDASSKRDGYEYYLKDNEIFVKMSLSEYRNSDSSCTREEVKNMLDLLVVDDGIKIRSTSKDINVSNGDIVCVFKEIGSYTMATVTNIIKDYENNGIFLELKDVDGNITKERYISTNLTRNYSVRSFSNALIENRRICKIVSEYDKVKTGYKIISNFPRIPNFPRGSVNAILGIVLDFGKPMIICSNGNTLWYDSKFDSLFTVIPPSDKKYNLKKFILNYKLSGYTPQVGDIVKNKYYNYDLRVTDAGYSRGVICRMISSPENKYTFYKNELTPIGMIFPRFENENLLQSISVVTKTEGDANV